MLISCNKTNVEGIYYYVEPNKSKDSNLYTEARSAACSMAGYIKLDDGYYYNGITGDNMRFKYEVLDGKVVIESQGFQLILKIIDENTIEYAGCMFKKKQK